LPEPKQWTMIARAGERERYFCVMYKAEFLGDGLCWMSPL
jgi:hypothetical protein